MEYIISPGIIPADGNSGSTLDLEIQAPSLVGLSISVTKMVWELRRTSSRDLFENFIKPTSTFCFELTAFLQSGTAPSSPRVSHSSKSSIVQDQSDHSPQFLLIQKSFECLHSCLRAIHELSGTSIPRSDSAAEQASSIFKAGGGYSAQESRPTYTLAEPTRASDAPDVPCTWPQCFESFSTDNHRDRYFRTVYSGNDDRSYKCLVGGCQANVASWTRPWYVGARRAHREHNNEWHGPYTCSVSGCSRGTFHGFRSQAALDEHQTNIHACNVGTALHHGDCTPAGCSIKWVPNLELKLKEYLNELSKQIFKKKNLRGDKSWWLPAFYSLCVQSFVGRALRSISSDPEPASKYLHLPVRLFVALSPGFDPIFQPDDSDRDPAVSLMIDPRILALMEKSGHSESSASYLKHLFEMNDGVSIPKLAIPSHQDDQGETVHSELSLHIEPVPLGNMHFDQIMSDISTWLGPPTNISPQASASVARPLAVRVENESPVSGVERGTEIVPNGPFSRRTLAPKSLLRKLKNSTKGQQPQNGSTQGPRHCPPPNLTSVRPTISEMVDTVNLSHSPT
jgi:hypothetical protein